jgi:UDP-2-acetamido-2-deoxy-ribo-hexuluronate aminotransferase
MNFVDLKYQQNRIKDQLDFRIRSVLEHGNYIMGPEIKELEDALSTYVGIKHAISCASGTDALLLALMAYNIGPGDAIFTSPFTFIATAEVISLLGATPVFVDINPKTFNLDPSKLEQAIHALKSNDPSSHPLPRQSSIRSPQASGLQPKGVIPVDLFGLPAEYNRINAIARDHGLFIIEDAAQSFGAEYEGKKACALADIACTSFFPAKPLGCYGDGGMCFTEDDNIAEIMRSLRVHGKGRHKYENIRIGINGRLDTLQAAILLAKFEIFPEEINFRQEVAEKYSMLLASCSKLNVPSIPGGYKSAWAQYSILASDSSERGLSIDRLKAADIPTAIYYPKPLHLQTAFTDLGYEESDFPVSEDCSHRIFSLPMHPYLTPEDQKKISIILKND